MDFNLVDESKAVLNEKRLPGVTSDISILLKRLDLIHPHITGNKWYKLKHNLQKAEDEGYDTILTFGGAFSNHIYSTAAAGRELGFKTIGIIRGEEYLPLNPTLEFAVEQGMKLVHEDRRTFRLIHTGEYFDEIKKVFGDVYILPEGGTNEFAVKGCAEIPYCINLDYNYLYTPCGTGGTLHIRCAGRCYSTRFPGS